MQSSGVEYMHRNQGVCIQGEYMHKSCFGCAVHGMYIEVPIKKRGTIVTFVTLHQNI